MPKAIYGYVATEFGGKIYVAGGFDSSNNYSYQFYCYDPSTNLWTEKSYINGDKTNPALAKTKHHLYAFGNNKTVHQYDLTRDIWTMVGVIAFHVISFPLRNLLKYLFSEIQLGRFENLPSINYTIEHCGQLYALCANGDFEIINIGAKCTVTQLQKLTLQNSPWYLFIH